MVLIHVIAKRPQSLDPLHRGGPQQIRMRMKCEMGWPRRRLEEASKANIGIPERSRVLYDVFCSRIPSFQGEQFVKPGDQKKNKRTIDEAPPPVRRAGFDRAAKNKFYETGLDNVKASLEAHAAEEKKQQREADRKKRGKQEK
eukprot:scaffold133094_cov26-Cyclotella_meneghiniana.AAC.1